MRQLYILFILLSFTINSNAQSKKLGLQFKLNSDYSRLLNYENLNNTSKALDAYYSSSNFPSIQFGANIYGDKYLFGIGFLVCPNVDYNLLPNVNNVYTEEINQRNMYLSLSAEERESIKNGTKVSMYGFNLFGMYRIYQKENLKINAYLEAGILFNNNFSNDLILKEQNSNNYYFGVYRLDFKPSLYISPRLELEYKLGNTGLSTFFQAGMHLYKQNLIYHRNITFVDDLSTFYDNELKINSWKNTSVYSIGFRLYLEEFVTL